VSSPGNLGAEDFDDLVRRYRRELHVHCYRMLGSFDEAEDHVQEVFLRAWRSRESFQGRSSPRTWLYRVATNVCLDTLRRDARRAVPAPSSAPGGQGGPSVAAMPWVQPYPDSLLDEVADGQPGPEAAAVSRETISLAFLAALQLLPPRQRAVLILRDVADWPAADVAEMLDASVPAVNSALQRARETLRDQWPNGRLDWAPAAEPDQEQRRLLERFIAAHEQADPEALIALLHQDVRLAIPNVGEWNGKPETGDALRDGMNALGQWRLLPITANGQPGAAGYLRRPGETAFRPFVLTVLRVEDGRLIDIAAFEQPSMFPAFGLPASLS
jgi:RNA polymerase sigma-70 factor, ECF subfamily